MSIITSSGIGNRRARNDALRALQGSADLLIYAVRTNDGLVKIGGSADIVNRLDHIKGGVSEILAIKPGTRHEERDIHRALSGHATDGREYYLPTPSVLKVVNAMRAPLGLEPVIIPRRWAA